MDKKQIIIDSARELFSRYGFKKVSMEEIAKKASVTKRTIYHYFKDKEALFSYFVKEELDKVKIILENNNNNNFSSRIVDDLKEILTLRTNSSLISTLIRDNNANFNSCPDFLSLYEQEIVNYLEEKIKTEINLGNIKNCNPHLTAFILYKIFYAVMIEYDKEIDEEDFIRNVNMILNEGLLIKGGLK